MSGTGNTERVQRGRVLVVDDEDAVRGVLVEILGEFGFTVVGEAADGLEAIEVARSVEPELVVLDLKMPRLDGIQTAARLRAEHAVRIVMFSAYDDEALRKSAIEAGADAYLVKGCPFSDVVAALTANGEADALQA